MRIYRYAAAILALSLATNSAHAISFQGLGFLPGDNISAAAGISADGSTVVGGNLPQTGQGGQAWKWTAADGMVGLGYFTLTGTL